ncbi:hypothetical protein LTR17_022735 [Elasticomyces elasticus]|nr:hypothetical protein LTR17_022735 [Elasticomyces elasticus]
MATKVSTKATATKRCYLLELPPELRLRIYTCVYRQSTTSVYVEYLGASQRPRRCEHIIGPRPSTLYRTCRTIHQEAMPVLYDSIIFGIGIACNSSRRVNAIGSPTIPLTDRTWLSNVRHLVLDIQIVSGSGAMEVYQHIGEVLKALDVSSRSRAIELVGIDFCLTPIARTKEAASVCKLLGQQPFSGKPYVEVVNYGCVGPRRVMREMEHGFGELGDGAYWW